MNADDDLNTEGSEKDKAEEAAAEKAFQASFKSASAENRDGSVHMVGGDDDADDDGDQGDDGDSSEAGDTGDDDQGDDAGDQDDAAGDKGKQDDKQAKAEAEPTIKDVIAMVSAMQTNVTRQVGALTGRLDKTLNAKPVEAARTAAANAAADKGKKVPSKERVEKALQSAKGFADMEKDFPDFASTFREGLTNLLTDLEADGGGDKPAPLDEETVVKKAVAVIRDQDQKAAAARQEAEAEYAKIEAAFPGWKEAINDKTFNAWRTQKLASADGPEYDRIFKSGSTRETVSVLKEFSEETGYKPKSQQSSGKGNQQQQASNKQSDRQRRAANRPQGSASVTVRSGDPEEEAFQRTFKERRG